MSHKFLLNASFHAFLERCDEELAREAVKLGCKKCGGTLHRSPYPRSPFGVLPSLRIYYEKRLSLCCSQCRKRTTTPSVRFFGRYWYVAPLLLIISALRDKRWRRSSTKLSSYFGIRLRPETWARWRLWWQQTFVETAFWQQAKGWVSHLQGQYPYQLFCIFSGNLQKRLLLLLQFLLPMTAGYLRAV